MNVWPDIPYERWKDTGHALHMWTQIVGKARLASTPWLNHSWHATLYVTARGITTSLIPDDSMDYEVTFDFVTHELVLQTADGRDCRFDLGSMAVSDFHASFIDILQDLGLSTKFHHFPNEVANPIPFCDQNDVISYDRGAARNFWQALVSVDRVFKKFRARFIGKASPVHLFWGSFDLAVTRFSGRAAPEHPGGIPSLPDRVTREAYSHEVSSAGFWPGGNGVDYPAFYSYSYPTPPSFSEFDVRPDEARFDKGLGEFILPYDVVRQSDDPQSTLLAFLESSYEAAAVSGDWNRGMLER